MYIAFQPGGKVRKFYLAVYVANSKTPILSMQRTVRT